MAKAGVYEDKETSTRSIALGVLLFVASLGLLVLAFFSLPPLSSQEKERLHIPPRSLEHVKSLVSIGSKYTENYYYQ